MVPTALIQLYDNFLAKQITGADFPGMLAELRELRLKLPRKGIKKTGPTGSVEPVTKMERNHETQGINDSSGINP